MDMIDQVSQNMQEQEQQQAPIQQQAPLQQYDPDIYVHKREELMHAELSKHQRSKKIAMVRENIQREMPGAYDQLQKIADGEQLNAVRLHHSRGTQLWNDGQNVLEFDIAGSGYRAFIRANKMLAGRNGLKTKLADGTKIKVSWKLMRELGALPVDQFEEKMQAMPEQTLKQWFTKQMIYENIDAFRNGKDLFDDTYGQSVEIEDLKDKKYILSKKKDHENADGTVSSKQRVTMAGPLNAGGLFNAGDYSIEKLRSYIFTMSQSYLTPIFAQWEDLLHAAEEKDKIGETDAAGQIRARIHEVSILLKGNSRGAVALSQGAMMTKYWVHENFPHLEQWVKFETIQYDPVPGFGSRWDENDVLSLTNAAGAGEKELEQLREKKMMPLGDQDETTLFYSMHQQHWAGFTPQLVKGAKRVILTPYNHSIAQDQLDDSQEGGLKRFAFTDAKTGEVYRSSGLNRLEPGLYFADEKGVLVRIPDEQMARRLVREIVKDTSSMQDDRHERMEEVIAAWFGSEYARTNTQETQPQPGIQQEQVQETQPVELTGELAAQAHAQLQEYYESLNKNDIQALEDTLNNMKRQIDELAGQLLDADAQKTEEINADIHSIVEMYGELATMLKQQREEQMSNTKKNEQIRQAQERMQDVVLLAQGLCNTKVDEILAADKDTQYRFLMDAYQLGDYLTNVNSLFTKKQLAGMTHLEELTEQLERARVQLTPVLQLLTRQFYDEREQQQPPVFADTELFAERMDVHEDMTAEDMKNFLAASVEYFRYKQRCNVDTDQSRFYNDLWERAMKRIDRSVILKTLYVKVVTLFNTQARLSYMDTSQTYINLINGKFPDVDEKVRQGFAYYLTNLTTEGQSLQDANQHMHVVSIDGYIDISDSRINKDQLIGDILADTYKDLQSQIDERAELAGKALNRSTHFEDKLVGKQNIVAAIEDEDGTFVNSHMQRENARDQYLKQQRSADQASVNVQREMVTFTNALAAQKQGDTRQILSAISQFRQVCQDRTGDPQIRINAAQSLHGQLQNMLTDYTKMEKRDNYAEHRIRQMMYELANYQQSLEQLRVQTDQIEEVMKRNRHTGTIALHLNEQRRSLSGQFLNYMKERAWNDSDEFIAVGTTMNAYLNSTSQYHTLLVKDSVKMQYDELHRALETYLRTRKNAGSAKGKRRLAMVQRMLDGLQQHEQTRERYYMYAHAIQNKS